MEDTVKVHRKLLRLPASDGGIGSGIQRDHAECTGVSEGEYWHCDSGGREYQPSGNTIYFLYGQCPFGL